MMMKTEIEALRQRCFRRFVLLVVAQHAAQLLQERDLVFDGVASDGRHAFDADLPLLDGFTGLALPLKRAAEIDPRRREVRIDRDRRAQSRQCAGGVARLRQ